MAGRRNNNGNGNGNGRRLATQQSVDQAVKSICDIMRRGNCAGAMQYVPELTWILFLRILDEKEHREEQEAEALGCSLAIVGSYSGNDKQGKMDGKIGLGFSVGDYSFDHRKVGLVRGYHFCIVCFGWHSNQCIRSRPHGSGRTGGGRALPLRQYCRQGEFYGRRA
ncbi:MAG: type I restriction-modification system subunit M N-terminal domain-containing protein [Syntrophales bacterium]